MAKKLETIKLIASLEKAAKSTKSALWADIAERLAAPTRNKVVVDLDKLDTMAKKNKGKILLVPGKVLVKGEYGEKAKIVAVNASENAKNKIEAKGEFVFLRDFAKNADKVKASEVIIVK